MADAPRNAGRIACRGSGSSGHYTFTPRDGRETGDRDVPRYSSDMASKGILTLSDAHQDSKLNDWYADPRPALEDPHPTLDDPRPAVVITGIDMSFGSMVRLALKWGTASLVAVAVLAAAVGAIYICGSLLLNAIQR